MLWMVRSYGIRFSGFTLGLELSFKNVFHWMAVLICPLRATSVLLESELVTLFLPYQSFVWRAFRALIIQQEVGIKTTIGKMEALAPILN